MKDAGELSRTLWGRVFCLTVSWHLATMGWERLAYPNQASLAALIPPAVGYALLVGYAGRQAGKWAYPRLRPTTNLAD